MLNSVYAHFDQTANFKCRYILMRDSLGASKVYTSNTSYATPTYLRCPYIQTTYAKNKHTKMSERARIVYTKNRSSATNKHIVAHSSMNFNQIENCKIRLLATKYTAKRMQLCTVHTPQCIITFYSHNIHMCAVCSNYIHSHDITVCIYNANL